METEIKIKDFAVYPDHCSYATWSKFLGLLKVYANKVGYYGKTPGWSIYVIHVGFGIRNNSAAMYYGKFPEITINVDEAISLLERSLSGKSFNSSQEQSKEISLDN